MQAARQLFCWALARRIRWAQQGARFSKVHLAAHANQLHLYFDAEDAVGEIGLYESNGYLWLETIALARDFEQFGDYQEFCGQLPDLSELERRLLLFMTA